ncbi:hypothetical protein D3C85_839380 [compost metagenome]
MLQAVLFGGRRRGRARRVDGDDVQIAIKLLAQPVGAADDVFGVDAGADAGDDGLARAPYGFDGAVAAIGLDVVVHVVGGAAQRQFAQRDQISLAKEILRGVAGLLGQIDLAFLQAAQQLVGGQVHEHDFIGCVEDLVGHRLPDTHARDAADRLVQAVQVLHVQRGPDVDAGRQQFLDVLPALGMARARRVGMGQFVHQHQVWTPQQGAVQVEFLQHMAAIGDILEREDRQSFEQCRGFAAAMGLDDAGQHVDALRGLRAGRHQHGVGLADPG